MGFILDGLETESYDRQYDDKELIGRIWSYFRPYQGKMVLVATMITLNSLFTVAAPIVIAKAIDLVDQEATMQMIALVALGISLLGASAWVFNFIRQYFSAHVVGNVVLQLRKDSFDATINHDMSFYDEHPSGKIVSRVTSDTQDFSETVSLTLNLMSQALLVIILTVYLATVSLWLTFLMLIMTPIAVGIALSFRKVARRVTQNARRVTAIINAQIQESISGITVAKSYRQEPAVYDTFDDNNQQGYKVGVQRGLVINSIFPILVLASGLGTAVLLWAGGLATISGVLYASDNG